MPHAAQRQILDQKNPKLWPDMFWRGSVHGKVTEQPQDYSLINHGSPLAPRGLTAALENVALSSKTSCWESILCCSVLRESIKEV